MFTDPVFTNAFVADGIIPEAYGRRTLVEYRSRLYTVPTNNHFSRSPSSDHMDIITPSNQHPDILRVPDSLQSDPPKAPDPEQGENSLRTLAKALDLSSMGSLNPSMYAVMRVAPPLYARKCSLAEQLAQDEAACQKGYLQFIFSTLRNVVLGGEPKLDPELSLLSWHWADDILAVVSGLELDRIYAYHFAKSEWELTGERHHSLFDIRAVAFRPFAGRVLAIGCRRGVALLDGQDLTILPCPGHTSVQSIDWSPDGQLLASASSFDRSVRLWDIATRIRMRLGTGSFVSFCPDRHRRILFVADAAAVNFKVWDCRTWHCERWGSLSGPVVAATWSADGNTLLFSTQGQSCIHVLTLGNGDKGMESTITHVEMTSVPREGPGGTAILLELDPTGERLAVVYEVPADEYPGIEHNAVVKEDVHRRFAIALYATQLRPTLSMTSIGYVSGCEGSGPPVGIKFKPHAHGRSGAVLTCMWRNGEVSFTHLFFNAARE